MPDITIAQIRPAYDIQYFLDCSVECMDMPPDVYFWAMYFCPDVNKLVDSLDSKNLGQANHSDTLARYGEYIEEQYLLWQQTASLEQVALCLGFGYQYACDTTYAMSQCVTTLIERTNSVFGTITYYDQFVRHRKNNVAHYDGLAMFERKRPFFESLFRIRSQWEALDETPDFKTYNVVWPQYEANQRIRDDIPWSDKPHRKKAAPNKETKKALKRSAELLNSVKGDGTVQLFMSGKELLVTGQKYKFSLTKETHSSLSGSHGTCRTRVYCASTNEFVASLCVYTPNVTVFDHLASIVLHCNSGLEDLIIDEANIIERGNIELLPEKTYKSITDPRSRTGGVHDLLNFNNVDLSEKERITTQNTKAVEKLKLRLRKKYPHLFVKKQVRVDHVLELFHMREQHE